MKPNVEWINKGVKPHLKFTFGKTLSTDDASTAIGEWRKAFAEMPGRQIVMTWEASGMTSYDTGARNLWQKALAEMRNQIDTIWLVTNSNIIRMGATIMALFSSLNIRVVRSADEITLS